jgi:urease accessory protein
LRLAWHIGNRHLAAAIFTDRILIRLDHVIAHMLEHQGARVSEVEAVFDPEGGAYDDHAH